MKLQTTKKSPKPHRRDDPEQSRRFIRKAREIGADKDSCADAIMGRLAHTPPQPRTKTQPPTPKKSEKAKKR